MDFQNLITSLYLFAYQTQQCWQSRSPLHHCWGLLSDAKLPSHQNDTQKLTILGDKGTPWLPPPCLHTHTLGAAAAITGPCWLLTLLVCSMYLVNFTNWLKKYLALSKIIPHPANVLGCLHLWPETKALQVPWSFGSWKKNTLTRQ